MLVLTRREGQRIKIADDVWLTVLRIGPDRVKLGFEAPAGTIIHREELARRIEAGEAECSDDGS